MPNNNVERAIKKANEASDVTPAMFEAYGPEGVGILITALTDNNNRTSTEIKHALLRQGASFGPQRSVSWNFKLDIAAGEWNAQNTIEVTEDGAEKLERLIDVIEENDDVQEVFTSAVQKVFLRNRRASAIF
jgi:transcriptional/translational regulatory protein YebC/TACO1